jgi:hypothetical protein
MIEAEFILGGFKTILDSPAMKPIRNLLHRRPPTDLTLSVLDRQDSLPYAPHVVAPRRKVGASGQGQHATTPWGRQSAA